jgi:serine/threonine-protein kinase
VITEADASQSNAEPIVDFGRYVVIETIGKGGMGTVRRAYDPKLCREVALKVLRQDRRGGDGTQRLVREAQAMAQLSHPNVVAVYDVEEVGGSVLIAMEYVPGSSLAAWLKAEREPRDILEAFLAAGRGLAAAHHAGLVHRDFKPANVLVGEAAEIKVTDFGIAKVSDGSGGSSASRSSGEFALSASWDGEDLTHDNTLLGTPRYMPPEQLLGEDATEASDQYAFCVSLWEALTGERAYPRGSIRAVAEAKLAGAPALPAARPVPRQVLEAIQRGMEPRPHARWEHMDVLLAALDPSLEPRGSRALVAGGLVSVGGALAAYMMLQGADDPCGAGPERLDSAWGEERRSALEGALVSAAPFARESWPRVEHSLNTYADDWLEQYRDTCEATHVRHEQSAFTLDLRMTCLERRRRGLEAAVNVLLDADTDVARRAQDVASALPPVSTCGDIERLAATAPPPDDPADRVEIEAIEGELTGIDSLIQVRRTEAALEALDALVERVEAVGYVPLRVGVKRRHGSLLARTGDIEAGIDELEEALALALQSELWREASTVARTIARRRIGSAPLLGEAEIYANLAVSLAESEVGLPEDRWHALRTLASVQQAQSHNDEALEQYERTRKLAKRTFGEYSPQYAEASRALAQLHARLGHYDRAEPLLAHALSVTEENRGSSHPDVADVLSTFAILYGRQGEYEEAAILLERTVRIYNDAAGPDSPFTARARINYGVALKGLERYDEARTQLELAKGVFETIHGKDHHRVADVLQSLGMLAALEKDYETAVRHLERSTEIYERTFGLMHLDVALFHQELGTVYRKMGRIEDAREQLETSMSIRSELGGPPHVHGDGALSLAEVLIELRVEPKRVRDLLRVAIEKFEQSKVDRAEKLEQARSLLSQRIGDADGVRIPG